MCFHVPANRIPVSNTPQSAATQGAVTIPSGTEGNTENYMKLGAEAKVSAVTSEDVSIKGMVNPPVATDFTESKQSLNELTTQRGDFSKVPDIDICGFMSKLPEIDIDLGEGGEGIPSLNDIMLAINGVTLPALQAVSEGITDIVGRIGDAIGDLGAAIQGSVPTITCGKRPVVDPLQAAASAAGTPALGAALAAAPTPTPTPEPEPVPYGTDPNIVIESPDVTVRSLDDTIDSGEF